MVRKTKLAAVLSASALFSLGAAASSLAATRGWVEENGVWQYLDSDEEAVSEEWRRSGTLYFWLDENGEMATDTLVEDDDDKYYVDANGARVINQWRQVDNEDGWTNEGTDEEPESVWYYFGSTGKAVTGKTTINGKVYIFDEGGEMFYSWTTYNEKDYYLGNDDEGFAYTGWHLLELQEEIEDEYDDSEGWFYFKTSGEMRKADAEDDDEDGVERVYINGSYYGFDANGVMVDGWVPENGATATGTAYYTDESGEQQKGWVYTFENTESGEDGDEVWYYLNSKGKPFNVGGYYDDNGAKESVGVVQLYEDGIPVDDPLTGVAAKVISSKTYLFDNSGVLLDGVYEITSDYVDRVGGSGSLKAGFYYFDTSETSTNGRMETGKTTVSLDGEDYVYYFETTGRAYTNMIVDGSLYKANGVRVDSDDGTQLYEINGDDFTDTVTVKGSSVTLEEGDQVVVSTSGKLKKSGTTTIDGTKYTIKDYKVTDEE